MSQRKKAAKPQKIVTIVPFEWAERAKALIPKMIRQDGMLLTLPDVFSMAVSLEAELRAVQAKPAQTPTAKSLPTKGAKR